MYTHVSSGPPSSMEEGGADAGADLVDQPRETMVGKVHDERLFANEVDKVCDGRAYAQHVLLLLRGREEERS